MATQDYHFITRWRVAGRPDELYDVLADADGLARWWPSVHLGVRTLERGDESGVGRVVDLCTKGWLPYTLRWRSRVTRAERPFGFTFAAEGDFAGTGEWTFTPDGPYVDVRHDWRVRPGRPLLRRLSFALKPVFAMNHRWAMRQGELSLRLELRRRRAVSEHERNMVPEPPAPTFFARREAPLAPGYASSRVSE